MPHKNYKVILFSSLCSELLAAIIFLKKISYESDRTGQVYFES